MFSNKCNKCDFKGVWRIRLFGSVVEIKTLNDCATMKGLLNEPTRLRPTGPRGQPQYIVTVHISCFKVIDLRSH